MPTECEKADFKFVKRIWDKGQFCTLSQCTNCAERCQKIDPPTAQEIQDWQ